MPPQQRRRNFPLCTIGAKAADLIQEVAALMNKDATLSDLADIVHAHPTLGEVILNAAHA